LTKVIVQLNKANENQTRLIDSHEVEKKKWMDAHAAEEEKIRNDHASEIKAITEKSDNRIELLQTEVKTKACSLRELIASSEAKLRDAHEQLASAEGEAEARVEELQSSHERERTSHAQTVRDISQSLEDQSRQHQANTLCLREELADEHQKRIEILRKEINVTHSEEFELLKSQYEHILIRIQTDASDQEKSAVKNAVATTRLDYEKKLSEQLSSHDEKYEAIKEETAIRIDREVKSLQENLDRVKLQAEMKERKLLDDAKEAKETFGVLVVNEKKLQAEVKRLQTSLDSMSSSNQKIIDELQEQNKELLDSVKKVKDALDDRVDRINVLEAEHEGLKALCDTIDTQKTSLESDLKSLSELRGEERQFNLIQSQERELRIQSLETELDDANTNKAYLNEELSIGKEKISELSKYKDYVHQALPRLRSLQTDANQCRIDAFELTRLLTTSIEELAKWKFKIQELHSYEMAKLKESEIELKDEVERLCCVVGEHERAVAEANATTACHKKKLDYMQETSKNAADARTGERLSWEKAMYDTKAQHKKELARICCVAQDEQDILGNQIAELKENNKKQSGIHERKYQLLETDWRHKMEGQNATISRIKYESALEIQGLSIKMSELSDTLASREDKCKSLMHNIELMREQQEAREMEYLAKFESTSQRYRHALEESKRLFAEHIQQKDEQIERNEEEMQNSSVTYQQRIDTLNCLIASERSERIRGLRGIKSQLDELHESSRQNIENIKREWEHVCLNTIFRKLSMMKQSHDETDVKYSEEIEHLRIVHSEAEEAFTRQIAARTKEAKDAKAMLFSTIREGEKKIERSLRHLRDDHDIEMETLISETKIQCEIITEKMRSLSNEYESLACVNAKKVDVIIQKDRDINQLKCKISDTVKSFEEEKHSLQLQHENERAEIMRGMQVKEVGMLEKHIQEKSELRSELQSKMDGVARQLHEANERWTSRPSLQKDVEQIKALQSEMQSLSITEKQAKEKMLYFKRELENREDNFNKRFSSVGDIASGSPLRVIQNDNAKSKVEQAKRGNATARRKVRGRAAGGSRKKKAAASAKLPKVAK